MSSDRTERLKFFMEKLKEMEEEAQQEELSLWGSAIGGNNVAGGVDLSNSPKYREIVALLHQTPLLVNPTLKFIQTKMVALSRAQLAALYTEEEIQELVKEAQEAAK